MQEAQIGHNLEVSAIRVGCMGMSFGYGPAKDKHECSGYPGSRGTRRHVPSICECMALSLTKNSWAKLSALSWQW